MAPPEAVPKGALAMPIRTLRADVVAVLLWACGSDTTATNRDAMIDAARTPDAAPTDSGPGDAAARPDGSGGLPPWTNRGPGGGGHPSRLHATRNGEDDAAIFALDCYGVRATADSGLTWRSAMGSPGAFPAARQGGGAFVLSPTMWVFGNRTAGDIYFTDDGGMTYSTWSDDSAPLFGAFIRHPAWDGIANRTLYAGTGSKREVDRDPPMRGGGGRFYKSTDNGESWSYRGSVADPPGASSADVHFLQIIVDPGNPLRMLAATSHGVYLTADEGASWTLADHAQWNDGLPESACVTAILADSTDAWGPDTDFYATLRWSGDGVFKKTGTGAAEWVRDIGQRSDHWTDLARAPNGDIWAVLNFPDTRLGLYRKRSGSWSDNLFVQVGAGRNTEPNWQADQFDTDKGCRPEHIAIVDHTDEATPYYSVWMGAGEPGEVMRARVDPTSGAFLGVTPWANRFSAWRDHEGEGRFFSGRGETENLNNRDLAITTRTHPRTGQRIVYYASGDHGLWRSIDGGESWQQTGVPLTDRERGPSGLVGTEIVIDGSDASEATVYVSMRSEQNPRGDVWRTTDHGLHWRVIGGGPRAKDGLPQGQMYGMVIHPADPAVGFVVDVPDRTGDRGVYRSQNLDAPHDEVRWTLVASGLRAEDLGPTDRSNWITLVMDPNDPNKLHMGTRSGLYYTRNALGACEWTKDSDQNGAVTGMSLSADGTTLLYATSRSLQRIADVSVGSHESWAHDTASSDGIETVTFEPNSSSEVWIGTQGTDNARAVQKTNDIGANPVDWIAQTSDWYQINGANALLIVDPVAPESLLFGAQCNALWANNP